MAHASHPVATSLYIHVPFCARKCDYCAFYSTASDGDLIQRYVDALVRELDGHRAEGPLRPETIFFGGGTPSLLNARQWEPILAAIHRFDLRGLAEWTIEANPATLSADKANLLRAAGVNRVSLGVQSLDESLLDRLGRVHSRDMVFRSVDILRAAGFDNLNLDLMFAIPGQTLGIWRDTLREAIALGSEHLSSYEVIYEEDTPLYEQLKAGEFDVDEELAGAMFDELVQTSGAEGFVQYEIANFGRRDRARSGSATPAPLALAPCPPGFEDSRIPRFACRHNVNYWRGGPYLALGPSASGFEQGRRYRNVANTRQYCEQIEQGRSPREWTEELTPLARAGELAAFGLRMNAGWPFDAFRAATGFDLREEWARELSDLVRRGWGVLEPDRFRLSPDGLRFADAAGSEFLRTPPTGSTRPTAHTTVRSAAREIAALPERIPLALPA